MLGAFGPLLLSSLILKASKSSSSHMIWLAKLKFAKMLKASKKTHSRRNMGINHITVHINPLK